MHTLLHIYGPFSIHSYGLAIAIAVVIFTYLVKRDSRFRTLKLDPVFSQILLVGGIAAVLGGKILFFLEQPRLFNGLSDIFTFWQPGFSVLGAILAVVVFMPWYLMRINIPALPFFDLISIYAPLLQSISRVGCFFAGCCFGLPTTKPWGIVYTDTGSSAPLDICMHPTQIYSAIILLMVFTLMYFVFQHIFKRTGQLTCLYLMLSSTERFFVDFWRGDRTVLPDSYYALSIYQIIAALVVVCAGALFAWTLTRKSS